MGRRFGVLPHRRDLIGAFPDEPEKILTRYEKSRRFPGGLYRLDSRDQPALRVRLVLTLRVFFTVRVEASIRAVSQASISASRSSSVIRVSR